MCFQNGHAFQIPSTRLIIMREQFCVRENPYLKILSTQQALGQNDSQVWPHIPLCPRPWILGMYLTYAKENQL
jgi:hypothetical protein